jgi:hypothetical protein
MVDATFSWLGCAVWRVWAAASSPIRPRIGNAKSPRRRAASPRPEEHDLVASTI